jgi:hypothetical protein
MCTMIGLITLTWAWIENSLAITIGVINEHAGPIKGHAVAPLSLSKRIDCLKVALRDVAALKTLQQEGRVLAAQVASYRTRRKRSQQSRKTRIYEGCVKPPESDAVEGFIENRGEEQRGRSRGGGAQRVHWRLRLVGASACRPIGSRTLPIISC